jgi:L-ascorbate metabolism protein UlaG (beta-lactamase superfamily)
MTITKYEHACFVAEDTGAKLVVDPGKLSPSLPKLTSLAAIVITHVHMDHIDEHKVKQLITDNPDVKVFSTQQVADAYPNIKAVVVSPGSMHQIGPFTLAFFGGEHATIHPSFDKTQNVGVLINSTLYYPGDSFALPGRPIKILAAPAAAPWMKISEAMDFISEIKPELAFPTHDAILSDEGKQIFDNLLEPFAQKAGTKYQRLKTGQSITI